MSRSPVLAPIGDAEIPICRALNNQAAPAVNELDDHAFGLLLVKNYRAWIARDAGQVLGFLIAMTEGAGYASANYRWFEARYDRFAYVDRVVISEEARGHGLGRLFYERLMDEARADGAPVLLCEVNLHPPNPGSMAFHERMGFVAVGQQTTPEGKRVALLERGL